MSAFTESIVEQAALVWLEALGWTVKYGPDIAPGEPASERASYGEAILPRRLRDALAPKPTSSELRAPDTEPAIERTE